MSSGWEKEYDFYKSVISTKVILPFAFLGSWLEYLVVYVTISKFNKKQFCGKVFKISRFISV